MLSPPQQRGLIVIMGIALLALGIPLAWPTRTPAPPSIRPQTFVLDAPVIVAPYFLTAAELDPLIDLNTASAEALTELPGIGPSLAERIVDHRAEHGPFLSVDELIDVSGIGEKTIEGLRERATIGSE